MIIKSGLLFSLANCIPLCNEEYFSVTQVEEKLGQYSNFCIGQVQKVHLNIFNHVINPHDRDFAFSFIIILNTYMVIGTAYVSKRKNNRHFSCQFNAL